jgi:hypothetical protein
VVYGLGSKAVPRQALLHRNASATHLDLVSATVTKRLFVVVSYFSGSSCTRFLYQVTRYRLNCVCEPSHATKRFTAVLCSLGVKTLRMNCVASLDSHRLSVIVHHQKGWSHVMSCHVMSSLGHGGLSKFMQRPRKTALLRFQACHKHECFFGSQLQVSPSSSRAPCLSK